MLDTHESTGIELSPLRAVRRHYVLVAILIAAFAALGALLTLLRPPTYVSTASLVLEDPGGSSVFGTARAADTERYVGNQVALLRSPALADRAAEQEPTIEPQVFISNTRVSVTPETEYVEISFSADDPAWAQRGANALAVAYQQAVQEVLDSEVQRAVSNIDSAIDEVQARIDSLNDEIAHVVTDDRNRAELDAQFDEILSEFASLRRQEGPPEEVAAALAQISAELGARLLILDIEERQGPAAPLYQQQVGALDLLSDLYSQRSDVLLEAGLAGDGVAIYSAAGPGQPSGIPLTLAVLVAGLVGAVVGVGGSYWLELRGWAFSSPLEPEPILGAPVLATIPDFRSELVDVRIPVRDAPRSFSAEAFRFLVVGIDRAPRSEHRTIAFISAMEGEGKSTIVANTAVAFAREGIDVMTLDADLGQPDLAELLVGEKAGDGNQPGITDVAAGDESLSDVVQTVDMQPGSITVVRFAPTDVDPMGFYRSVSAREVVKSIQSKYELVLIDVPPILDVAYAAPILSFADQVVVVVSDGSESARLRDVRNRLDLLGVEVAGYVYNRAPLRRGTPRPASLTPSPATPAPSL